MSTNLKLYEPGIARVNFYCSQCENKISVGENCTNVTHPVEYEDDFPEVTTICEECLFAEAE